MEERSCSSCGYHKSKSNPTPGKLIPGESGKCTRPEGPCKAEADTPEQQDAPLVPEIAPERIAELDQVRDTAAAIDQAVMDAEVVHRALGRIEGMEFLRRVGDVAVAQVFTEMRNSKKYKGLPYHDEGGNLRHVEDFEEFCKVKLGKSYTRCYELSKNLALLGSDLYESAEKIGFRAKDYRALKALPEAEQAIVKQALESESKEDVLTILEDMAARHQAEREAAKRERDNLTADCDARGKLLENKAERLEKTERELFRLKSLPIDADLELRLAREAEAVKALENTYMTALVELNKFLVQAESVLASSDISVHTSQHVVATAANYCRAVNAALVKHEIPVDFEEEVSPEWMRDSAEADLEAGQTHIPNGRGW